MQQGYGREGTQQYNRRGGMGRNRDTDGKEWDATGIMDGKGHNRDIDGKGCNGDTDGKGRDTTGIQT